MDIVGLLTLVLLLALVGFVVYLIVTYIPMPAPFKQVIIVVVVILIVLWLIATVAGSVGGLHLPRVGR